MEQDAISNSIITATKPAEKLWFSGEAEHFRKSDPTGLRLGGTVQGLLTQVQGILHMTFRDADVVVLLRCQITPGWTGLQVQVF